MKHQTQLGPHLTRASGESLGPVQATLLAGIEKHPELHGLRALIDNMPSDEQLTAMEAKMHAELDSITAVGLGSVGVVIEVKQPSMLDAPAPKTMAGSKSITVRVPASILNGIKKKATQKRMPYQTFINQLLRAVAMDYKADTPL